MGKLYGDHDALAGKNAIRANQIIQCKKECAERKITVKQWCEEHGLKEKSYWYYLRNSVMPWWI